MRRITITEQNNLYTVEVSDGRRSSGATFESALRKLFRPAHISRGLDEYETVEEFFDSIIPTHGSAQIGQGQAAG